MRPTLLLALATTGCAGAIVHPPTSPELLDPMTGRASVPMTASAAGAASLRLAVYGDTRGGREAHRSVVEAIRADHPAVVLFTGDALRCLPIGHMPDLGGWQYLVPFWPQYIRGYGGAALGSVVPFPALLHQTLGAPFVMTRDPDGWNAFLEDTAPLRLADRVPLLFVPGNHDVYHDHDREEVARLFALDERTPRDARHLYFSTDAAGYRIVVLDTGDDMLGDGDPLLGDQLAWLRTTLDDADRQGLHVVVAMHMPPFSSAAEDGPVPWVRTELVEGVFDKHHISLVLTGHAHAYERIERNGVQYVITGGGGAPFHHENHRAVDPGSRAFVEGTPHYVALDLSRDAIHLKAVAVKDHAVLDEATWAP